MISDESEFTVKSFTLGTNSCRENQELSTEIRLIRMFIDKAEVS
ncbi:hypothetical protein NPIL_273631, partial [Nephila pilipes]